MFDRKQYMKKWKEDNAETIKRWQQDYYQRPETKKIQKDYYQKNKQHIKQRRKIKSREEILKEHNITAKQYQEFLNNQNNKCAICGINFSDIKPTSIHIDHDHNTNKIRGILCLNCNIAIGLFKDNIYALNQAIKYLQK